VEYFEQNLRKIGLSIGTNSGGMMFYMDFFVRNW